MMSENAPGAEDASEVQNDARKSARDLTNGSLFGSHSHQQELQKATMMKRRNYLPILEIRIGEFYLQLRNPASISFKVTLQ